VREWGSTFSTVALLLRGALFQLAEGRAFIKFLKGESTALRFKGRQKETLMPLLAICTSVITYYYYYDCCCILIFLVFTVTSFKLSCV